MRQERSTHSSIHQDSSALTHELANPLMVVIARTTQLLDLLGFQAEAAQPTFSVESLKESLGQIELAARHMEGLIRAHHTGSRAARGAEDFRQAKLDDVIRMPLDFAQWRASRSGTEFRIEKGAQLPAELLIECRPGRLVQILLNLLGNAFDAVETDFSATDRAFDRRVSLKIDRSVSGLRIEVANSGPMIPESIRARVMEPYFTTKSPGKGTGLGLAISKEIATEHGGTLRLKDSTEVQETCFVLDLPCSQKAVA